MKKLLMTVTILASIIGFAHEHGENIHLEKSTKYEVAKNQVDMDLEIGTHEEKLVALFEEGHVNLKKVNGAYEPANKSFKIYTTKNGAQFVGSILLFDRSVYNPNQFEEGHYFHSYNAGFPHFHIDFNKDYTEAKIEEDVFKGKMVVDEDSKDMIFTEKNGLFKVVLYGQANDNNPKFKKIARVGEIFLNVKFNKVK